MFDRIKDLISDPGSIGDKLGELGDQFGIGQDVQDQLAQFGGLGAIQDQLGGINFPIGQDDLANILEQRGVPGGITDQLHNLDIGQFNSPGEVLNVIRGFAQ
ncbi:MAG TPA: DUF2795 domain-containing protein [Thermomicrobiales bacterium]|jgi:hypothetical protein|nr:DUF2795 domain-containing protein [Thermomicrobiales bacterium]